MSVNSIVSIESVFPSAQLWKRERFPVLYEAGEPKAVLVDVASFAQIELMLDNLLHRELEPEDALLAQSEALPKLLARAQAEPPAANWQQELNEL
jgi:hypothetical protein